MKSKYLIPLITLLLTGCNTVTSSSSDLSSSNKEEVSYTTVDPSFSVRIVDSCIPFREKSFNNGNELNVHSTYSLCLAINNKEAYPSFKDCRFEYDNKYLEIKDCVIDNERSYPEFTWYLKPLEIINTTSIKVFYLDKLYSTYDVSIKDLAVESSNCASIAKTLDSASEYFPDEIKVLRSYADYEEYLNRYNYFNYIKNQPTGETFRDYDYAYIRIFSGNLGREAELNSVFVKDGTLYFDVKSTKNYYEAAPDITMTTVQSYFLCLVRFPSGLNVSNYSIWYSSTYVA